MSKDISITEETILEKIKEKTGKLKCASCGSAEFGVAPGFGHMALQNKIDGSLVSNAPFVPVAYTVCHKCGAMTPYSVAILGLLNA
ncbi:hypothetical protein BBW65_03170 [Helicobacter enhydrae]|uniref:Uncharacterized protein n=1 Tax=Helicobacter enhydrae TaxID=222136 RepID=A0A1B1U523_9HELI|nr:hypothetical protein [Helicobacter enhydrae]ANV97863.1 hypothetical protein BBW65_03170 [Helicobacter enhydrae]